MSEHRRQLTAIGTGFLGVLVYTAYAVITRIPADQDPSAPILAPFSYTRIIWMTALGYLV